MFGTVPSIASDVARGWLSSELPASISGRATFRFGFKVSYTHEHENIFLLCARTQNETAPGPLFPSGSAPSIMPRAALAAAAGAAALVLLLAAGARVSGRPARHLLLGAGAEAADAVRDAVGDSRDIVGVDVADAREDAAADFDSDVAARVSRRGRVGSRQSMLAASLPFGSDTFPLGVNERWPPRVEPRQAADTSAAAEDGAEVDGPPLKMLRGDAA